MKFDCGIMISASHNPYYDNGIKLINGNGEKMDEETISLVEDVYMDGELEVFGQKWPEIPFAKKEQIGCTVDYISGRNRYVGYLISLGMYSFRGKKVGLDCANGSSWNIAKAVFDALGAKTYVINAEPDGRISTVMRVRPISKDCRDLWWKRDSMSGLRMTATQTAASVWMNGVM